MTQAGKKLARGKTGSDVSPIIHGRQTLSFTLGASRFYHLRPTIHKDYADMDTQRQDNSAKKPLSAGANRPDSFWGMIVTRLGLSRPSPTIGISSACCPITQAEELKSTQSVAREERTRQEAFVRAQPAHLYISDTEPLERVQSMQSDRHTDNDMPSEDKVLASDSTSGSVGSDEESSGESDNIEGSDGDGEYKEDSNETTSDTSGSSTRKLQTSYRMSRSGSTNVRGRLGKLTKPSAPKWNISSQPASIKDKRPRKRGRFVVEESDEDMDEEVEDNDEAWSGPYHVNRSREDCAQTQGLSSLKTVPPLSRHNGAWTKDQEKTLCRLRNEGKDWEYIGERVLGRTATSARRRWERLRSESLKFVGKRNKGRLRRQDDPLVLVMAKPPRREKPWSKEEEQLLVHFCAQGMTVKYASRHMQGRGYGACQRHWRRIKDRYPFASSASKLARMDGESVPSGSQDNHSSSTSQREQEADDADLDSWSARLEGDDVRLSTNGNSPVAVDTCTVPRKRLYAQAVLIYENPGSADGSKRPKFKTPSTDDHDQQAANPTTVGETFTPGTKVSLVSNQPGIGSFNARGDLQMHNEPSLPKDSLLREPDVLSNERGQRKMGQHRRSSSWPYSVTAGPLQ